jgi:polynucleotide 5'-kinase involved in rRNA processing
LLGVVEAGKSALRATDSANIVCIVGPARSGKSTLANALFGDFLQETFTVRRSGPWPSI